jgi:DNA (cytosine-5)-methyltransferase 1
MRVGSLFTGYGGLDMAVGGDLAWYAEIEPAACQVLTQHHPDVPNLGDITEVNWSQVEPVDIITGGYPCQPFSHAGSRKGKDDERHLWPYVRDAIHALRPKYAILENVSGHLTLGLADVLADLTEIGFNAEWGTYRASDIGAPHRRERVFIIAHPSDLRRESRADDSRSEIYTVERHHARTTEKDHANGKQEITGLRPVTATHAATNTDNGHGETVGAMQGLRGRHASRPDLRELSEIDWGKYEPAIRRWEGLTRPAPDPTYQRAGRDRLNPSFVEWMMGLPEGHVTGHGLSTAKALKMLGNGVVPQQAAAAISQLMERTA